MEMNASLSSSVHSDDGNNHSDITFENIVFTVPVPKQKGKSWL